MKSKPALVAGIIDDIRRLFQVLSEQSRKIEHETNLTGPQLWVIKMLEESSPLKVTELARRMYLNPTTMVGLLDRLESRNLVSRTRSDKDRRVVYITLTDQGRDLVKNSPEVVQSLLVKGLETFTAQKLDKVSTELNDVIKILGVHEVPPKLIMSPEINLPRLKKKVK